MIIQNVQVYLLMWSTADADLMLALFKIAGLFQEQNEWNSIHEPLCHNTFLP